MRPIIAALTFALALVPASAAEHCVTYSTNEAELATDLSAAGRSTVYTDIDWCQLCTYGFMLWIYEESNGVPGLQRGDEMEDDTCHGTIQSDTIVF